MIEPDYPFVPKSTRYLKRGQFWAIPLGGGRYGAGCVVGVCLNQGTPSTRLFIAGVLHWVGNHVPSSIHLQGCSLAEFGFAHLKAITESGGSILGTAELELSTTPTEANDASIPTWGYNVPRVIAKRLTEPPA